MAIKSINKNFKKEDRDVSLLAKDFSSYKQRLIDFAKTYFPNSYADFSDSSIGSMFIELVSYVGDVLSYNIDYNFKESLLSNASENKNIIRLAQALGYKVPLSSAAVTELEVYQLLPINGSSPDWTYALQIRSGMRVASETNPAIEFRTLESVDFSEMRNLSNLQDYVSVYQESDGSPQFYLVKYYRNIATKAGVVREYTVDVGEATQFFTIELPEDDVIDVVSIVDSDGNTWYEVDYLAQSFVNIDYELAGSSGEPFVQPSLQQVNRRFITKVNSNLRKEIQFGSGISDNIDENVIRNIQNTNTSAIDPIAFATSQTYGKAPSNTTLTIRYTTGGGVQSNVAQNDLNVIKEASFSNSGLSSSQLAVLNEMKTTLTVTNPNKATGGSGVPSAEEIRQNALKIFSSQKRCVTADDYRARILNMPSRYGRIAKAYVTNESFTNQGRSSSTINAFLLSYDTNQNLTAPNTAIKKNISQYLNQFRMLTDGVNLLNGYVINIGVDFEISVYGGYNSNEVILKCIEEVKSFFSIDRMEFNQPIYVNDLELTIGNVEGVRTVHSIAISNKVGGSYSGNIYDIANATREKIIYPSIEPSVFEVKFPNSDIKGKVK